MSCNMALRGLQISNLSFGDLTPMPLLGLDPNAPLFDEENQLK